MNFNEFVSGENLISLFFGPFLIVLSLIYLIYAIVLYKQTKVMTKTVQEKSGKFIVLVSFFQLLIAVLLVIFAFVSM